MRSDLISIDVIFQTRTKLAVCVRETETSDDTWLPLSQVEIEGPEIRGHRVEIIAPEWLLLDKGLI